MIDRTVAIRSFRREDLAPIAGLSRRAAVADDEPWPPSLEEVAGALAPPALAPERDCVVAEAGGGELVGYAYVALQRAGGELLGRGVGCVGRERRREGLGERLWRAADERFAARATGAAFVERCLLDGLPGSREIAARLGYRAHRATCFVEIALDGPALPAPLPERVALAPFARERDARAVFELERALFGEVGHAAVPSYAGWTARRLDDPRFDPSLWLVAVDDQGPVGLCVAHAWATSTPERAWIPRLGVLPRRRRSGLGRALLSACFERLGARGFRRAALGASGDDAAALALYHRAGMRVAARYVYHRSWSPESGRIP